MNWKLVTFEDGVKAHFIPECLMNDICDELYTRFMQKPFQVYDKDSAWYDPGGMVMKDEESFKWITPPLDLMLEVRHTHFDYLYDALNAAPLREVNGKQYYKIHGWIHCIVLLPAQRDYLLKIWADQRQEIQEKVIATYLEFERRMAEVNKEGVKVIHTPKIKVPEGNN